MLLQPDSTIHHPWSERCLPIPPGWLLQHSVHSGEIWWRFSPASFFFSLLHPFLLPFYSSPHLSVSLFRRGPPPKKKQTLLFLSLPTEKKMARKSQDGWCCMVNHFCPMTTNVLLLTGPSFCGCFPKREKVQKRQKRQSLWSPQSMFFMSLPNF